MANFRITGSIVARNSAISLVGQLVPLGIAVVTIPLIVRGLGTERFGLLSLAWVVLGYLTVFDLGLARALTKFLAEALGRGEGNQVAPLVWTTVLAQCFLGILGMGTLAIATPFLVERGLAISSTLIPEAKSAFYVLALAIPVVLVSNSARGVLEAAQRFDFLNIVRIPASASVFILPVAGVLFGLSLPAILASMLLAMVLAAVVLLFLAVRVLPPLREFSPRFKLVSPLVAFGGWITVSSVVGPILVYLDRFLIASVVSVSAVAYYSVPFEATTRISVIAGSLVAVLFPAFSALGGAEDSPRLAMLVSRSLKYLLLAVGTIVLGLVLFAKEILSVWVGASFAAESTLVLQILGLGVLFNSVSFIPYALLQGTGRPDVPAKLHLLELPLYVVAAWILVSYWGAVGAAAAWSARVLLDGCLLFVATFRLRRTSLRGLLSNGLVLTTFALVALACFAYGLRELTEHLPLLAQSLCFLVLLALFGRVAWRTLLDAADRKVVVGILRP